MDTLFERRVSSVSLGDMVSTGELLSAFDIGGRSAAEHIGTEALLFQTVTLPSLPKSGWAARRCSGLAIPTGRCGRA